MEEMARIELDVVNYVEEIKVRDGNTYYGLQKSILDSWLNGLDNVWINVMNGHTITFIGPINQLIEVINRYEQDPEMRQEIIDDIR